MATSSSRVLVNGRPIKIFKQAHRLWQGDPLSPMLFILAIDPVQIMTEKAVAVGHLKVVLSKSAWLCCSLYDTAATIFANPDPTKL